MGIITTIIVGFFIGLIARFLMPGKDPAGFIVTTLLGVGGALVGSYFGRAMGWYGPDEGAGFILSVIGALLILFVFSRFSSAKSST